MKHDRDWATPHAVDIQKLDPNDLESSKQYLLETLSTELINDPKDPSGEDYRNYRDAPSNFEPQSPGAFL